MIPLSFCAQKFLDRFLEFYLGIHAEDQSFGVAPGVPIKEY